MKRVIIIGASSGIGHELARLYARKGNVVGVCARREEYLENMKAEYPDNIVPLAFDITSAGAMEELQELIFRTGGADLIVMCAGVGYLEESLDWEKEKNTIDVNVIAFTRVVNFAYGYFRCVGGGHFAAVSSIAGIRGLEGCPAYSASKAYNTNYLEAVRKKCRKEKLDITITSIIPGYVDTALLQGTGLFWVATAGEAAKCIYRGLQRKKREFYVTPRWGVLAFLLRRLPNFIYERIF